MAIIEEFKTALRVDRTMDWIGFPEVPDQVLEAIQNLSGSVDGTWLPPDTEHIYDISQVE